MKWFKKKDDSNKPKLKIRSTVYPDGKILEWYGAVDKPKKLKTVFDKL
jgi:hypothetical protein